MPPVNSIPEIFEYMSERFQPDKAEGVDAIFQFNLTGDPGGQYWLKVVDQQIDVHEGEHSDPTMILTSSGEDYLAVVNGDLAPMTAFMQGKIKVKGDMGLALKLQSMFDLS
jgi:putative sterol carrier protein